MDKVRIAVIGIGAMGTAHLVTIAKQPKFALTAVCDIIPERARAASEKYNCRMYTDSDQILQEHVADAVLIATPHYFHTTIGMAALTSGHHVLVEKPISVHKADCERLIAAHQDKSLVFAAMFNQRTDPYYKRIRRLVKDGELGRLTRVNWIITDWFRTDAYYASGSWRATWKGEGGGVLLNQCPHNLDLLQWICGMPARVHGFCELGRWHPIEVEDQVTAYLEYPGLCTGVFITTTGEAPGTNRLEIAGDRGKLVCENGALTFIRNEVPMGEYCRTSPEFFGRPEVWRIELPVEGTGGQHAEILANFADAILAGAALIAPAEEGINSVELANSILYSSLTGRPVELPLDSAAYERKLQELIQGSTYVKQTTEQVAQDMSKSFR